MNWQMTTTIWLTAFVAIAGVLTGAVVWQSGGFDGDGQVVQVGDVIPGDHEADDVDEAVHDDGHESDDAVHEEDDHDAVGHEDDDADEAVHDDDHEADDAVHEEDDHDAIGHEAGDADEAVHDDDHDAVDHEADETDDAAHEEEGGDHDHAVGTVDPDALKIELEASEFTYDLATIEIEAGQPVTIVLHNDGFLEHDITIEGFENLGGAHTQPGEEAAFTVAIDQPGEYRYYCTIPGHLEAGMEGLLTVK